VPTRPQPTPPSRTRGLIPIVAVLALAGTTLAALPAQARTVTVHRVIQEAPELVLVVAVEEDDGRPAADVAASEITVELGATDTELVSVERYVQSGMPSGTLLLVDTSCSMGPVMGEVREATRRYVEGMAGGDQAIVGQFNDSVMGIEKGWSADPTSLSAEIDALQAAGGSTHLYEAVNKAVDAIGESSQSPPLSAILILSDGKDEGSPATMTYDRARAQSREHAVPLNSVGFVLNPQDDKTDFLQQWAKDTGGRYQLAESVEDVSREFERIQDSLHQLWVVRLRTGPLKIGDYGVTVSVGSGAGALSAASTFGVKSEWAGHDCCQPVEDDPTRLYVFGGGGVLLLLLLLVVPAVLARKKQRRFQEQLEQRDEDAARAEQERQAVAQRVAQAEAGTAQALAEAKEAREAADRALQLPPFHIALESGGQITLFANAEATVSTLGTDEDRASLVLPSGAESKASGLHAQFVRSRDGSMTLEDLGSTNGTYVDGQQIEANKPVVVVVGQKVQFGLLKAVLQNG
jgi:hypothetical protein